MTTELPKLIPVAKLMYSRARTVVLTKKTVVTWCLRTYIGLRPYMANVYIKERINDQTTICAGGVTGNTTYLGRKRRELNLRNVACPEQPQGASFDISYADAKQSALEIGRSFFMVVANCNARCYWLQLHCSQW